MKKLLSIALLALGIAHFTFAAENSTVPVSSGSDSSSAAVAAKIPQSLPQLGSLAELRTFVIDVSRYGNVDFASPGMAHGGSGFSFGLPENVTSEGIIKAFALQNYDFELVNTSDWVQVRARTFTADWDELFVSENRTTPRVQDDDDDEYVIDLYLGFELAEKIPVKFDRNTRRAQLKYLDTDGRTVITLDVNVVNGKVYFPTKFVGRALLLVWGNEGEPRVYDLRNNGKQTSIKNVETGAIWSYIRGVSSYRNPGIIEYRIYSWQGQGDSQAFEITMTQKAFVNFRIDTSEGAYPVGYKVRAKGASEWTTYQHQKPGSDFVHSLAAGDWYVVPIWNPDDFREWDIYVSEAEPTYPGGKGRPAP